jgi:hypothetical protein
MLAGITVCAARVATQRYITPTKAAGRWTRSNYRDRDVSLLLGPAVALGAVGGAAVAASAPRRAAVLAVSTAALVGGYDDLYGSRHARGLAGHARALRDGQLTTGVVKLVAVTGAAAVASAMRYRNPIDAALGTVVIAGGANLVNLFDLRPGRALKVTAVAASALGRGGTRETRAVAAAAAGVALAALPDDLGERAMLGDCGAGALGALLGWSAGMSGARGRRALLAAGVVGLTAASERVSFSAVIERQPLLRAVDRLGRREP